MDAWATLASTSAAPWAGRARYAAAMTLYQRHEIPAEVLEIYRICCRRDGDDALAVLSLRGIGATTVAKVRAIRAGHESV